MKINLPSNERVRLFLLLAFFLPLSAWTQDLIQVNGKVLATNGSPISGASVVVQDSSAGATTIEDGSFFFETALTPPFKIYVSATGYNSYIYNYSGSESNINIQLISIVPNTVVSDTVGETEQISVTSRRRKETAQDVPIPVTVIGGNLVADAGAFNVNRVKELVPTVQLYSSNPRNTTLNIRGLGSTFGLTNDGIDPGVGYYLDGVYYARPAATVLDFIDIEQIEVLRGPQGTLFGKNTTAGAFNITSKKPSFKPGALFEVSYGNYGYIQAKSSITGPLGKKVAGRLSFSGTQRNGLIYNVRTDKYINDLNNLGFRGQLLITPSDKVNITLAADATSQKPDGYAQVVAGVVKTQRPGYRQFEEIIRDLNYTLPSTNPFDRKIDHDTPWKSGNELGGGSVNIDAKIGPGTLTSTTSYRYWKWDPSNDRDFTGLPVLRLSQATSIHSNWSQEVRYAGKLSNRVSGVIGVFAIGQDLKSDPYHIEESGAAQWRFSQNSTSELWKTPGLFEGYGIKTKSRLQTFSGAIFSQVDWAITEKIHVLPGLRVNYDEKKVDYERTTYGGLETNDPDLLALKRAVYSDQAFKASVDNVNLSGQLTLNYKHNKNINTFATYSTGYKPVGVNLGGLPTSGGAPMVELATIKPEDVRHYEVGVKTNPIPGATLNVTLYNTDVKDFQTLVQTAELGVNRGYLSNAEKVRVRGVELDASVKIGKYFSIYGSGAYTDGKYVSFTNAPVPLEETGGPVSFKDISGGDLPGISKWAGSLGGEASTNGKFLSQYGKFFLAIESFHRSSFSSSPSPSKYLNIDGYSLVNARLGFRTNDGFSIFVWSRNLLNKDYFEQLLAASGNAGHYAGVLGDPRTMGITIRQSFGKQ
ncbi:MAG TPA: TonB-dependent receptor [Cytophagaceae bacterium]